MGGGGGRAVKPAGSSAVMASRARGLVAADSAQAALWRALEFFPTPPWAGRAVLLPIPPGTRARLTRPDDARLFGARAGAMELFEGEA
jgi:hypothetical protein